MVDPHSTEPYVAPKLKVYGDVRRITQALQTKDGVHDGAGSDPANQKTNI
jgi:hypothetical protein